MITQIQSVTQTTYSRIKFQNVINREVVINNRKRNMTPRVFSLLRQGSSSKTNEIGIQTKEEPSSLVSKEILTATTRLGIKDVKSKLILPEEKPRFHHNFSIHHLATNLPFEIERIGGNSFLYRELPLSLYTEEELEVEHPIVRQTVDELCLERYKEIGIGSHGTLLKNEASIREKIRISGINNFDGDSQKGEGFYVGVGKMEFEMAAYFSGFSIMEDACIKKSFNLKIMCPNFFRLKGLIIPRKFHWWPLPWKKLPHHSNYISKFDYLASFVDMGLDTSKKKWVQVKFNERSFHFLEVKKEKE